MRKLIALTSWLMLILTGILLVKFQPVSWSCATSSAVGEIVFSPDSKMIVVTRQGFNLADLWTMGADHAIHPFETPGQIVLSVAFSPDGKSIVSGNMDKDFSNSTARIWDVQTGTLLHTLTEHKEQIMVAYSADNRTILSTSFDGTARLWEAQSGKLLHSLVGHTDLIFGGAFSPDGKRVVTELIETFERDRK